MFFFHDYSIKTSRGGGLNKKEEIKWKVNSPLKLAVREQCNIITRSDSIACFTQCELPFYPFYMSELA